MNAFIDEAVVIEQPRICFGREHGLRSMPAAEVVAEFCRGELWLYQFRAPNKTRPVLIISRDVVIVVTVAIISLAMGPRTFQPTIFGKLATATYIVTAVVAMLFNYLGYHSILVDAAIWASLAITLVSGLHYIWVATRIIEEPQGRGRTRVA